MDEIKRYLSENRFDNFKKDIATGRNPLIDKIRNSGGELDLQFRPENKLNIYYKGNSLAGIEVQVNNYVVKIHEKFDPINSAGKNSAKRFPRNRFKRKGNYYKIKLERDELLKFFQNKIIESLSANIKSVNNGEEITFEQSLITDNLDCEDIIIIDRQVAGGGIINDKKKKGILDLLALKKTNRGKYKFVVLEVKLGNNKDLEGKVVDQIIAYMNSIRNNIKSFKKCYETNYAQKKEIGLFPDYFPDSITIDDQVDGKIVVGLYSKIGEQYIKKLTNKYPEWKKGINIIQFKNELNAY